MSLVEKAIRKLQESAPRGVAPGQAPLSRADVPAPPPPPPTNIPVLSIDRGALRAAGLLPPEPEERQLAQQYRLIKRPLIANAFGRGAAQVPNGHLIVVTSAMSGEGKTFTSLNLAFSLAVERDLHVLLVDADVAKPHISRLLGVANSEGLLDALRDPNLDMESLIRPSDVANLSVLPAGMPSRDATELLASQRMQQVAAALGERDRRRVVLFDSPPLLQTTESHVLTQAAGQVVVVVRAETTPQPVLLDALKLLAGHTAVSMVLNQSMKSATSDYYYYGYGDDRST